MVKHRVSGKKPISARTALAEVAEALMELAAAAGPVDVTRVGHLLKRLAIVYGVLWSRRP